MTPADRYHHWVEWSDEDQTYLGKCPDLITGIHGDDPAQLYRELRKTIDEVVEHFNQNGKPLPPPRTRPMVEVA